jgi:hypothetical protein
MQVFSHPPEITIAAISPAEYAKSIDMTCIGKSLGKHRPAYNRVFEF